MEMEMEMEMARATQRSCFDTRINIDHTSHHSQTNRTQAVMLNKSSQCIA